MKWNAGEFGFNFTVWIDDTYIEKNKTNAFGNLTGNNAQSFSISTNLLLAQQYICAGESFESGRQHDSWNHLLI